VVELLVAFDSPIGTSKTLCGLLFLRGRGPRDRRSLLQADADQRAVNGLIEMAFSREIDGDSKDEREILTLSVSQGNTDPIELLQRVEEELEQAKQNNTPVDRVLVSNLSRWEIGMPLFRKDPVFAVALMNLLRRYRTTAVLVCGSGAGRDDSVMRQIVLENADCVLQFSRIEYRGEHRHLVRAIKIRGMAHRREAFELVADKVSVTVGPSAGLLRVDAAGRVSPERIALFLDLATETHSLYAKHILSAIRTTLSPDSEDIHIGYRRFDPSMLSLGADSAVDELQVCQLDEFQLPQDRKNSGLHEFPYSGDNPRRLGGRLKFQKSVLRGKRGAQRFLAVPFYATG
jgi:hypothetical protein